jgi:hypothetical protein
MNIVANATASASAYAYITAAAAVATAAIVEFEQAWAIYAVAMKTCRDAVASILLRHPLKHVHGTSVPCCICPQ